MAGSHNHGVVTSTNYGDGSYPVYIVYETSVFGGIKPSKIIVDMNPKETDSEPEIGSIVL